MIAAAGMTRPEYIAHLAAGAAAAGASRCGDIGDNPREVEYEPLTAPAVPEPIRTPAPAPAPEPVKEPTHV